VVALGVAALLWWLGLGWPPLAGANAPKPQEKFDLIKIALTVTGGIGGVVFLVIAYRKQRLGEAADRREDAKEKREDTKFFNERFTKAAEQLGHDAAAVRLAGVYAMAGLADDWIAHRQTCIDVLCAYLRMHYDPEPPEDVEPLRAWHGERQVRHTVVRIIAAHLRTNAVVSWQDCDLDFSGAVFDGGDFSKRRSPVARSTSASRISQAAGLPSAELSSLPAQSTSVVLISPRAGSFSTARTSHTAPLTSAVLSSPAAKSTSAA
jgi:hypothetical protein